MRTRLLLTAALTLFALLAAACGADTLDEGDSEVAADDTAPDVDLAPSEEASGAEAGGGCEDVGTITVGSANFPESQILANLYAEVLEDRDFDVERNLNIGSREVYFPALQAGELDLFPEYIGATHAFLAAGQDGSEAEAISGVEELRSATEELLSEELTLLESSEAQDQDALAVTQETADEFGLETTSDLAEVDDQFVIGGPPEEETRPTGLPGLQEVYGLEFSEFRTLDAGGPLTREALRSGEVDVARVFSTQGFIEEDNLVILEDDEGLVPAENITPIARTSIACDDVVSALNETSAALTTESLTNLNFQVEVENANPEDVATQYAEEQGLLGT